MKPFADFQRPELRHLNEPLVTDYLRQPRNIKFERKPKEIAQQQETGVYRVRKFEKSEPFHDSYYR